MEVVIDGRGGWGASASGTTLGAVFKTVQSRIGRRAVIQFVLDGEDLSPERQTELSGRSANDYSLLEVKTVDPQQFARDALRGTAQHLDNLQRLHEEASRLIQATEYGRATERLTECYGGWDTLSRAVRDVAAVLGLDIRTIEAGGIRADERIRRLNQTLMRFRGAMEFRDVMRLADIADRDLRPAIVGWRALVEHLESRVR